MKNILYLLTFILIVSCGGEQKREFKLRPAKGGKFYGGTFRTNEEEYFKSLYPLNITEVVAHRICDQIFDGLVTFDDSTLAVIPALASSWDIDATATTKYRKSGGKSENRNARGIRALETNQPTLRAEPKRTVSSQECTT